MVAIPLPLVPTAGPAARGARSDGTPPEDPDAEQAGRARRGDMTLATAWYTVWADNGAAAARFSTWAETTAFLTSHPGAEWRRFDTEEAAIQWLESLIQITPTRRPVMRRIEAWLLSVCDGTGVPRLAAYVAAARLAGASTEVVWTRVLVVEHDPVVRAVARTVVAGADRRIPATLVDPEVLPNLEDFPQWCEDLAALTPTRD